VRILVVDDDENKARDINNTLLSSRPEGQEFSVTIAHSLANAIRLLNQNTFDLIVIDLMLPYVEGGPADSRAGLELLRQLRTESGPNKETSVVGISAFPEEIASSRPTFDELGVVIAAFDDKGTWNRTLLRLLEGVTSRRGLHPRLSFVVICALEEERMAFVHTTFEKMSEAIVSGLNVHYVRLAETPNVIGAVVRLSQMGLVAATFETTTALSVFRTDILGMSGICAGVAGQVNLGQLVVAAPAWEYQSGKWAKNAFEIAPMQVPLPSRTRSAIDQVIGDDSFVHYVEAGIRPEDTRPSRQSKAVLAPVATGSAVIADAGRMAHIQQQHRKLAAVDMETFGLYFSAHEAAIQHFFSVKCVVDLADVAKGDDLHRYGCVVSARATERILHKLLTLR
jgi:adenosylhomocysteine nucleosidase